MKVLLIGLTLLSAIANIIFAMSYMTVVLLGAWLVLYLCMPCMGNVRNDLWNFFVIFFFVFSGLVQIGGAMAQGAGVPVVVLLIIMLIVFISVAYRNFATDFGADTIEGWRYKAECRKLNLERMRNPLD